MITTLIIAAFIAVLYYIKMGKINRSMRQFPGPQRFPVVGNFFQLGNSPAENMKSFQKMWKKYGNNFRIFVGPFKAAVILSDPRDIEIILTNTKWLTKSRGYTFLQPWLGTGLLTGKGEEWRRHRKIITPTFHFKILEQFLPIFHSQLDVLINKMSQEIKKGEAFDVYPYVTLFGLDVICETAMGQHVDAQNEAEGDYVQAVKVMCNIVNRRSMNPFYMNAFLFRLSNLYKQQMQALEVLHGFIDRVIETRKQYLLSHPEEKKEDVDDIGTKKRMAFLDLMLKSVDDQGSPLPDHVIRDEVHTFMFAGHDTTTIAISFACYLLSRNSDVQEKAFQEQRDIMGDDLSQQPSHSEIQDMKYLEMVTKEVLRLYPPAPFFSRIMTEDANFRGKIIAPGCGVVVAPFLVHRNPEQFPDPEKFDPERFTPEQQSKRHQFSYIPFSAGSRNCIGQKFAQLELKSTVSRLLRHFEFIPSGIDEEMVLSGEITMKSLNGIHIKIKPRKYN